MIEVRGNVGDVRVVYVVDIRNDGIENCNNEDIKNACLVMSGILKSVEHGGYYEGNRNTVAVDLACSCHVLGIDAKMVAHDMREADDFAFTSVDETDLCDRLDVIEGYLESWDNEPNGVFDKMLATETWKWENERYPKKSSLAVCVTNYESL